MFDVLKDLEQLQVLDKGHVRLVDVMPRLVDPEMLCDAAIVQAARVSYGKGTKTVSDDRSLIRYMMRNSHTSVFEQIELKFHIKMPIFVSRQFFRHRTVSANELSARYSEMEDDFYVPEYRLQSIANKQGSSEQIEEDTNRELKSNLINHCFESYNLYKEMLAKGVSRELARIHLPLNIYTQFYWKQNLHNLFHLLKLRMDSHAQWEIQEYARAIYQLTKKISPIACEAFEDYTLNKVTVYAVDGDIQNLSKREQEEVEIKKTKLLEIFRSDIKDAKQTNSGGVGEPKVNKEKINNC